MNWLLFGGGVLTGATVATAVFTFWVAIPAQTEAIRAARRGRRGRNV